MTRVRINTSIGVPIDFVSPKLFFVKIVGFSSNFNHISPEEKG